MKSYDMKSSVGSMLKSGTRTIGMGLGLAKTRPLVLAFQKTHNGLKAAQAANNAAEDALILAEGDCDLQKELANETLDELQIDLEGVVRRDFKHPLYKGVFPKGLTAFKDQSAEAFAAALPDLIETIRDSGEQRLKKYVAPLQKHVKAFDAPLAQLKKTRTKAGAADLKLKSAKEAWLDGYASLEGSFHAAFPRRKRFVAAFFPQASGSKSTKKRTAPPAGGAGGPAAKPNDGEGEGEGGDA